MRIQWSSEIALEMLSRLQQADERLQDCARQAQMTSQALIDADPERENKALIKALERFEACAGRIRKLQQAVVEYRAAVRRADQQFEEAESELIHMAEDVGLCDPAPQAGDGTGQAPGFWDAGTTRQMPEMRVPLGGVPGWLEDAVRSDKASTFI